jgi:ATP-dependent Clp protease adaptor protein ClpS
MPIVFPDVDTRAETRLAKPAWVILYNDDHHTFDDVASQLMKAIGCTYEEGEGFALIVHTQGKARVFDGARTDCERVAGVLREIRLQVEVDWDD